MAKFEHRKAVDELLEYLEQSEMLEKLLKKVKRIFNSEDDKSDLSNADKIAGEIRQKCTKPEIIYQDRVVEVEKVVEVPKIVEKVVEKIVEVPITPTWAKPLERQHHHYQSLVDFPRLSQILLRDATPSDFEGLLCFISSSSQWTNILRVWEELSDQCRATQTSVSSAEMALLQNCIDLFNLTQPTAKAVLYTPNVGERYDYHQHNQVIGTGDSITQVLLSGLYNGSGEKIKSALVICE